MIEQKDLIGRPVLAADDWRGINEHRRRRNNFHPIFARADAVGSAMARAVEFYKSAFGAIEVYRMEDPGGAVVVRPSAGVVADDLRFVVGVISGFKSAVLICAGGAMDLSRG